MTNPRRSGRARLSRPALLALAAASVTTLAACGSGHRVAAPPPPASTTTTTSAPATTTTTIKKVIPRRPVPIVAPFTGLSATRAETRRPAVVVKIDNLQEALPQTGPNQADIVYEEMVEGGLTRLAAVFQSDYPRTVGPVRSGRLTDEGIADDLAHPVLAYAGANALFQPQLAAQPVTDVDDDTNPSLFVRNNAQQAPHNLYTDIAGLAALDKAHTPPAALWSFRPSGSRFAGRGVAPAVSATVFFPAATAQWTWSSKHRVWLRTQNLAADLDSHGSQLSASNVIIQFIPYATTAYVTGEGAGADGAPIPGGEFVGSGPAWYLSGGAVVKGTWSRASLTARTVYKDSAGAAIQLQPGRTWVELPETGTTVVVTH